MNHGLTFSYTTLCIPCRWSRLGQRGERALLAGLWTGSCILTWPSVASTGWTEGQHFDCSRPHPLEGLVLGATVRPPNINTIPYRKNRARARACFVGVFHFCFIICHVKAGNHSFNLTYWLFKMHCRDFFHPQNMIIRYYYNIIRKNFFKKVYSIC